MKVSFRSFKTSDVHYWYLLMYSQKFPGIGYGLNSFSNSTDVRIKYRDDQKEQCWGLVCFVLWVGGWGEGEGMWGGRGWPTNSWIRLPQNWSILNADQISLFSFLS
jgi:hypothetical protein